MKYKICIAFFITAFVWVNNCQGQRKIDTTVKIGKVGYRLICYNKETENNELDIKPIGFDNEAREHMVYIKGKMTRCEIDDLNSDGYPDVMVYTTSGGRAAYGNAYAIVAVTNKSFMPVGIPDVQLDPKNKDGYRGHDEFSLLEGLLMRKFPVYKPEDTDKPTGGRRIIQYQLIGTEETGFKFKPVQSFETK